MAQIGSVWGAHTWGIDCWGLNTWGNAIVPPAPSVQPAPSSLHLGPLINPVTPPGFGPPESPFVLPNVIGGGGRTKAPRTARRAKPVTDTRERVLSGTLTYRLALGLAGAGTVTTTALGGQIVYAPLTLAMQGRGAVDERPAFEEEAFLMGLLLSDED